MIKSVYKLSTECSLEKIRLEKIRLMRMRK
nr:MAG TPA: hypothetical protein [Bacteriophage sp.]